MSNETNIKIVRRGDSGEVGSNWWKTLLLLLAIAVAFFIYKRATTNSESGEAKPSVEQPAGTEKPVGKPSEIPKERGPDGLFPLSAP